MPRIELEDDEPVADALSRLRRLIHTHGGYPLICQCKWHKANPRYYEKPSVLNRRRRWNARVRMRGSGLYGPAWELDWADNLLLRPRRSWGPLGRTVAT